MEPQFIVVFTRARHCLVTALVLLNPRQSKFECRVYLISIFNKPLSS
jgi:hypothetical protein